MTIVMDREIPNYLVSQVIVQLDGTSFLVITEKVFNANPDFASGATNFEYAAEQVLDRVP